MVFALVVHPRYLEGDEAVRLDYAFEYGVFLVFGVLFDYGLEAAKNLAHGLMELRLIGIAVDDRLHYAINIFH